MKNWHFITDANNKKKIEAVIGVLTKLPVTGFYFDTVVCEQEDYRPISIEEIETALGEKTKKLFEVYRCPIKDSLVYAVTIQKGTNLKNVEKPPQLICAVSIFAEDASKITMATNSIDLPEELRRLVLGGTPLYDAYGIVFGEKVKNKEISIYEHLTGKTELSWFEETVFKAFIL